MMNKWFLLFLILGMFSACGALHDGNGWEHNMDKDADSVLTHEH